MISSWEMMGNAKYHFNYATEWTAQRDIRTMGGKESRGSFLLTYIELIFLGSRNRHISIYSFTCANCTTPNQPISSTAFFFFQVQKTSNKFWSSLPNSFSPLPSFLFFLPPRLSPLFPLHTYLILKTLPNHIQTIHRDEIFHQEETRKFYSHSFHLQSPPTTIKPPLPIRFMQHHSIHHESIEKHKND